ncbi:hypothetical protein GRI58_15120 [Porphyrobacter algicida]|uniref:Uncharacterized protein n=1 Tax=Qipengyuania algicida TaxID=1836209 RepID=A0A845AKZ1_9SPHN|nr:hypothetical protein [Qipengyuania algicida]MXP30139.1 hypothetical protein [Qipengyuania algicida]
MSANDQQQKQPSRTAARHLAERGEEHIARVQATVDLARAMLASGEVNTSPDNSHGISLPPYPWEVSEVRSDQPKRVWYASVENFATGEGHTVCFAAGRHRDEDEFRRQLAGEMGRGLANTASVSLDVDELPLAATFLTDGLKANFAHMGQGGPAVMTYFGKYYANYT